VNQFGQIAAKLHDRSLDELVGEDIEQHRKFRRFTRSIVGGLAAALIAFAIAAWAAWQQRTIAISRELAATALVQVAKQPDLGQLLALEALNNAVTAQAEDALRETLIKAAVKDDFTRMPI
jgi:hypothetical protein